MDLKFATDYLDRFINFERKEPLKGERKLANMQALCKYFGHPELETPCIHVAGSKGKGSITTMVGSILKSAGCKKVGLYRSPALAHFTDRISEVDGPFPESVYKKAFKKLESGVEKILAENKIEPPTYYELVTLFAFLVFKEAGCDFAVYEVGMGGRLDATNVVNPKVAVINTIELEHTKVLGDTLEKIAIEKAGIIKKNVPVVIGPQPTKSVENVFAKIAKEKQSGEVVFIQDDLHTMYFLDDFNHLKMHVKELNVDLKLPGDFQAKNALVATTAARLVVPNISDEVIKKGLERTFLPGRFEIITSREISVILDGAHTKNSISSAVKTLEIYRNLLRAPKPILLFACAKDKNVEEMAKILESHFSEVILTSPGGFKTPDLPRAKAAFLGTNLKMALEENYLEAIKIAFKKAAEEKRSLVVLGSFYLVSEVKLFVEQHS